MPVTAKLRQNKLSYLRELIAQETMRFNPPHNRRGAAGVAARSQSARYLKPCGRIAGLNHPKFPSYGLAFRQNWVAPLLGSGFHGAKPSTRLLALLFAVFPLLPTRAPRASTSGPAR